MNQLVLFLSFLASNACTVADFRKDELQLLSPGKELLHQYVKIGGTVYYRFSNLQPSTSYEIKLSYPATVVIKRSAFASLIEELPFICTVVKLLNSRCSEVTDYSCVADALRFHLGHNVPKSRIQ